MRMPKDAGLSSLVLNGLGCACKQGLLHSPHLFSLKPICVRKAEPSGRQLTAFPVQSLHISWGGGSGGPPEPSTVPDLSERDATVKSAKLSTVRCCTGIALSPEKMGKKSWCSATSSDQLGLMLF